MGWVVYSDHYLMAFRSDPARIEVGEPFALVLNVCTKSGARRNCWPSMRRCPITAIS